MDDFPAGPACPGPRRLRLSVVAPVYNGGPDFELCLRRLRESAWTDFELLVVDDGSTDDSANIALAYGATVIRHESSRGPAAARNTGAKAAAAPLVFFVDADVVLHPDAMTKAIRHFDRHPEVAALFGSYDDRPTAPGLVSQYRNLLHHFVHQHGHFNSENARPAHTFWTGCGAIRREAFLDAGGFDPELYPKPAIEDIELGYRLTEAGHRIHLVRTIQATHLKRWTLGHVVKTDILRRGVPWMLLQWRRGVQENDLNVERSQKLCAGAIGLAALIFPASLWMPSLLAIPILALLLMVIINRDFYRLLAQLKGRTFATAVAPLHALYYLCCVASVVVALGFWLKTPREARTAVSVAHSHRMGFDKRSSSIRIESGQPAVPSPKFAALLGRFAPWSRNRTESPMPRQPHHSQPQESR